MKISTFWLLSYLDPQVDHDALMDAFPKIGLEIEESTPLVDGGFFADLNVLANRPDCLGMIGIAREVAAHMNLKLKLPSELIREAASGGSAPFTVEIRNPEFCPRYAAHAIANVKVGPSPKWLSDALISVGQRSISNVVDITNFVMLEYGEPLHAFDFDRVDGKKIIVRTLEANETLDLLGGKTIDAGKPDANPTLVICDASKPLALAGIMGGKSSETREATTNILLEAAHFNPENIRKTRKRVDLSTESSYRFERGVDPNFTLEHALARATSLICELAGGTVGEKVDVHPTKREPKIFSLSSQRVTDYLGAAVNDATIRSSLTKLDMEVDDKLSVTVPTWRFDVTDPVVLIEDVARSIGYDTFPTAPTSQTPTLGKRGGVDTLRDSIANYLSAVGFFETKSPALVLAEETEKLDAPRSHVSIVRLKNPMTKDHGVLRTRLLPSLVRVAERNFRHGAVATRFYEIDKVYSRDQATESIDVPGAIESFLIAGIAGGQSSEYDWTGRNSSITFFDLKGAVEDILELSGTIAQFEPAERLGYSKDATAAIVIDGQPIGFIGEVDKNVIDVGKTSFKLFGFELELSPLLKGFSRVAAHSTIARTPSSVRDLAFVVKANETYSELQKVIRDSAGKELESLTLIDIYRGAPVPAGHQSLAIRLTFRAMDRTLTAEEVQSQVDRVVAMMKEKFGATLRA